MVATRAPLQTEFSFTLPCGYPDERGTLHRHGVMRRATAIDEIQPLADPRTQANPAYVSILLLARVVTELGEITPISPGVIEGLFAADFSFLQELYMQVNEFGSSLVETACPACDTHFALDLANAGDA
jgi:hypothetical protein